MHELNIEVWKATEQGRASRDFDFHNEIRDAADSAERNVAVLETPRFTPPQERSEREPSERERSERFERSER
jgi:hypothetical protein